MRKRFFKKVMAHLSAFVLLVTYIIPSMNITAYAAETSSKIDVWDFGAEQLDTNIYNNNLTPAVINSWYSTLATVPAAGTSGINLPLTATLGTGELTISTGAKAHRMRTVNTAITRYDAKSLSSVDGSTIYNGYFYSNAGTAAGATPVVYLNLNVQKNDIVTLVVASNGLNSTINFEAPSGKKTTQLYTYAKNATNSLQIGQTMTFYAGETGTYRISSADEKLCVARIYREHTDAATLSGSVTAPTGLVNYSVLLTNHQTGEVITAPVTSGSYSATVSEKYTYDISLKDATGYVVSTEKSVSIPADAIKVTQNIGVVAVNLNTVSGTVTGLLAEDLAKVAITFVKPADKIYQPVFTMDKLTGIYSAQVESGVEYAVTAANINDSSCGITSFSLNEDSTMPIAFTIKPKYDVALTFDGLSADTALTAVTTFTNLNESGYSYSFTGTSGMKLRNGTYSVSVATGTQYVQKLTSNLVVNDASLSKTVGFAKATTWDFSNSSFTTASITANKYNGLGLSGVTKNGIYALINTTGSISIPVSGNCKITVNYCYAAAGSINGAANFTTASNSTAKIETVSYNYVGEAGSVPIILTGKTYITSIVINENQIAYKPDITVGATGCDYTTINAALTAIRSMERVDSVTSEIKRVTVSIQPGNYEEMLVVDLPNVTLKNASSTPSIDLTNKGVSISDQAVRITSYYGHGYYYYSMGTDCKYNSDILAVNKANGYQSFNNPGSGSTNGSYWNATVVINGSGFEADGIIFENSYNQYISQKEANDTVVAGVGNKGTRSTTVGDTSVQNKSFVERAACLSIMNDAKNLEFSNCKFVGRQDSLYGGTGVTAVFNKCNIMGATDYIFGGMTAVFYKCDLTMNTSDDKNDVAYLTAAQQSTGRGYLMYGCNVKSTIPGVDTASTMTAKPGYFGRPWQGITSEVVYYGTTVDSTTTYLDGLGNVTTQADSPQSLITGIGWNDSLGGKSDKVYEFATTELAGVDNSTVRATWSKLLSTPYVDAGATLITMNAFLGDTWISTLQAKGKLLDDLKSNYTLVNRGVAKANALTKSNYVDFAGVISAINAITIGLGIIDQASVNTMATNITTAINALVKLPASYTALNSAITTAEGKSVLNYTTESYTILTQALTEAKSLSKDLKFDEQTTVDAVVTALNKAVLNLVILDASYTELNSAITKASALTSSNFTTESYAVVTAKLATAKAVPTGLKIDVQATIDTATKALNDAVASLVRTVVATTDNTGSKIVDNSAFIPSTAKFEVAAVVSGTIYEKAKEIVKEASKAAGKDLTQIAVFELNLTDTVTNVAITQLDGKVSVSLPIPSGFDLTKTITVFRVETDGSLTRLDTKIEDGRCVFETNHFSTYIIAEEAVVVTPAVTPVANPIVPTGDTTPVVMYMLIMGISAGSVLCIVRKRRLKRA